MNSVVTAKKKNSEAYRCFPGVLTVKNPPASAGDLRDKGFIPELGRSPGGGHGNPLQYSCLENPIYTGTCWAIVHKFSKSWT